jgi:hypothetical protein
MIVPLPGGVRYHVLVGYNLYWFNLSDLTKVKNDIFDYQNATVSGFVKINVSAQEPKYVAKRAVKILKYSCDTFIYRLYSLEANVAGSTGRFLRSRDIVTIGGETITNSGVCSLAIHSNNNIDIRLEYSISEMELSPNKNELVFSGGSCLLRVDVSGSQFGSAPRTCFNSSTITNDSNRFFCGVEYLTDTLILLSQFQTKDSSSANQGLYLYNKIHHTFTKITNSDGFKYSYLEKGRDGKAYFTKGDGLYRFDRNSSVISKVLNLTLVPTLPFLKLVTVEFSTPEVRVFSLPSIIDNYENETLNDKESVVNSGNCVDTGYCAAIQVNPLSNRNKAAYILTISPNPTFGNDLHIQSDMLIQSIQILNSQGQMIMDQKCERNNVIINGKNLMPGVYFVKIQLYQNKESIVKPIIVNHQ